MVAHFSAAALLLALLTACGGEAGPATAPPTPTTTPTSSTPTDDPTESPTSPSTSEPAPTQSAKASEPGTTIVVRASEFGEMLFDAAGQAIYLFDVEKTAEPSCYGACAEAWPPVLTAGDPVAGRGVSNSVLGTTDRADGTVQVTYNDHPLYFYAHEEKREVKCHDVFLNGGNWYVVQPDGNPAPPG